MLFSQDYLRETHAHEPRTVWEKRFQRLATGLRLRWLLKLWLCEYIIEMEYPFF
jgi:hypothetical protein